MNLQESLLFRISELEKIVRNHEEYLKFIAQTNQNQAKFNQDLLNVLEKLNHEIHSPLSILENKSQ